MVLREKQGSHKGCSYSVLKPNYLICNDTRSEWKKTHLLLTLLERKPSPSAPFPESEGRNGTFFYF